MMGKAEQLRCDYFEHDADVGIIGRGVTLDDAFTAAAEAMFAIMVESSAVRPLESIEVAFEETDLGLALVRWLNELLGEARVSSLALGRFDLRRDGAQWHGEAWGEPWHDEIDRGVEVKGATLTMLDVAEGSEGWEARCVVDV
jgi:SHS2 domain-containing protein